MKIKLLELFAGYGSQAMALKRLGIDVESEISEIDKYAIQAYNQIHGETKNWGDITKIDENQLPTDYDMITYSFCCQDLSFAGLQKGMEEGSGTRSSLLWECQRIIKHCQPKYLMLENVKALVSKKFKPYFDEWLRRLDNMGYNSYWQVLNAKDYGVPQNRERVFVISVRKDVDDGLFKFPEKEPLTKRLKDILEETVDEKFYLKGERVDKLLNDLKQRIDSQDVSYCLGTTYNGTTPKDFLEKHRKQLVYEQVKERVDSQDASYCIDANYWKGTTPEQFLEKHRRQLVYDKVCVASRGRNPENPSDRTTGSPTEQRLEINDTGCSNTLTTVQKDNYVLETAEIEVLGNYKPSNHECGRVMNPEGISPTIKENHGAVCAIAEIQQVGNIAEEKGFSNPQCGRVYSSDGVSPTLNTCGGGQREPKIVEGIGKDPFQSNTFEWTGFKEDSSPCLTASNYKHPMCYYDTIRIRKLTPKECFRLMGVADEDFDKLTGISNSQKYKLAGNSIVVDCMVKMFANLFNIKDNK